MKGVHWGFVLGMVLVVILVLVGSGTAQSILQFKIADYIGIQPPNGGDSGIGGGGGGIPSEGDIPAVERDTALPDGVYTTGEVGYDIAKRIYEDYKNYGKNGNRGKCIKIGASEKCFIGVGKYSAVEDYHPKLENKAVHCGPLDETCVTVNLANLKVGIVDFCGGVFITDNSEEVTFGNGNCFPSSWSESILPPKCSKWDETCCSKVCGSDDQIGWWEAWQGRNPDGSVVRDTNPVNDNVESGKVPIYAIGFDNFYFVEWNPGDKKYAIKFFATPNNKVKWVDSATTFWDRVSIQFYESGRGSFKLDNPANAVNLAGLYYPQARQILNVTWQVSGNEAVLVKMVEQFQRDRFKFATNSAGEKHPLYTFDIEKCNGKEDCLSSASVRTFTAKTARPYVQDYEGTQRLPIATGLGGKDKGEFVNVGSSDWSKQHKVHVYSTLDRNENPPPGTMLRVVVNKWFTFDYGSKSTYFHDDTFYKDFSIIIYPEP